jgi:hypothetical protein
MLAAHRISESPPGATLAAIVSQHACGANTGTFDDRASAAQLLAQIRWHRIGLRLQQSLPASLASSQRLQYQRDCQSALKKTAANIQSLLRIVRCLDERGIPYLSLKGPALGQLLYGSALIKESGDIDILVRPQDTLAAIAALQSIGMVPSPTPPHDAQTWKTIQLLGKDWILDDSVTGCHVELHWKVEINPFLLSTRFDDWFARKSCINIGGSMVNMLCLQDLFIQVMVHGARSMWTRLHWLLDFDALLRRNDIDWQQVTDVIANDGLQQILHYSWNLSHRMLDTPLPAALARLIEQASPKQQLRTQKLTEATQLAMRKRRNIQWLSIRLCYFRLKQKIRFQLFELMTLIGPHQPDVMHLPLPIYLFPIYFLLRPWFVVQRRLSER